LADLIDRAGLGKVVGLQSHRLDRGAKAHQSFPDSDGILGIWSNPDIDITGAAWGAMDRDTMYVGV
jgi:hypothetical protein